jgi:hypothetical protein
MSDDVDKPPVESFKELKARLKSEQASMTKEDVLREQGGIDLDNLPKQEHHWVKRGIVMSCEGMNHPNHRHFLVRR